MPTSYTVDVQKGISFKEYALNCAKAFGALVSMRDECSTKEVPEVLMPQKYHLTEQEKAESYVSTLLSMSTKEAESKASSMYIKEENFRQEKLIEYKNIKVNYQEMLIKTKNWVVPSSEHNTLKTFMTTQLEESIVFDCDDEYYRTPTIKLTGEQWLNKFAPKGELLTKGDK